MKNNLLKSKIIKNIPTIKILSIFIVIIMIGVVFAVWYGMRADREMRSVL